MWVASRLGFFSIVRDLRDASAVQVRARRRAHLDALRRLAAEAGVRMDAPISTPGRDYPWRVIVADRHLPTLLAALAADVEYTNFKAAVGREDPDAAAVYGRVWAALMALDDRGPARGRR